jgi:predicted O-methyltransferase YrrM
MKRMYQIISFLKYVLFSGHFRGDGIHSPFLFRQINVLFREHRPYYCYAKIEKLRRALAHDDRMVFVEDYGTGNSRECRVSQIAKCSLPPKHAQLLFRLVNDRNPKYILELGTSLGLTTSYLASVNSASVCHTIEGAPKLAELAKQNFSKLYINNIVAHVGNIDEILPEVLKTLPTIDFAFFDANHTKEATMRYFHLCLSKINGKSMFVFDDIHWSEEMASAWNEIKNHPKVRVSLDVYEMGILYFDEELQKGDFVVRF